MSGRRAAALLIAGMLPVLTAGCRGDGPPGAAASADEPLASPSGGEAEAPEGTGLARRKWSEGIAFFALGTEPFWSLDFDPKRGWFLREPEGLAAAVPPEPLRAEEGRPVAWTLEAETEGLRLAVRVIPERCRDAMSGAPFTHRVEVELGPAGSGEPRELEGCGRFTADPALAGPWSLHAWNGAPPPLGSAGRVRLVIRPHEDRYDGHDGCNAFRGILRVTPEGLEFDRAVSTRMACPEPPAGAELLRALGDRPWKAQLAEHGLLLRSADGAEIELRR